MKKIVFNQVGGFPLNTQMLTNLQDIQKFVNALANLGGDKIIISGCTQVGQTISNGLIYLNGELIEFRESDINATATIVVREDIEEVKFGDDNFKQAVYTKYAQFGLGTTSYTWADFKKSFETKLIPSNILTYEDRIAILEAKTAIFQSGGGMFYWNKPINQIPVGFAPVADATWKARLAVNFDVNNPLFNAIGKTGGFETAKLTVQNLPPHRHEISETSIVSTDYGKVAVGNGANEGTAWTDNAGGYPDPENPNNIIAKPFDIMNPYKVCVFIEWVGLPVIP